MDILAFNHVITSKNENNCFKLVVNLISNLNLLENLKWLKIWMDLFLWKLWNFLFKNVCDFFEMKLLLFKIILLSNLIMLFVIQMLWNSCFLLSTIDFWKSLAKCGRIRFLTPWVQKYQKIGLNVHICGRIAKSVQRFCYSCTFKIAINQ